MSWHILGRLLTDPATAFYRLIGPLIGDKMDTMGSLKTSLSPPSSRCFVESLPNELLSHVFSFLDSPQPSASQLLDEPRFDLTKSDHVPIKSTSLVSRRWRQAIIPLLFKHAQFTIESTNAFRSLVEKQIQPFFDFIVVNKLQRVVQTFTLLVHDQAIAYSSQGDHGLESFSKFWSALFGIMDPLELLIVAPSEALGVLTSCSTYLQDAWAFDCPCQYLRLQRKEGDHKTSLASQTVLRSLPKSAPRETSTRNSNESGASGQLHETNSQVEISDNYVNQSVSSVGQEASPSTSLDWGEDTKTRGPNLWEIRPWYGLLLNEGSFIRAYATYEFWLRQPPSILQDVLGEKRAAKKPLISPTIRDFSYIGMFPMSHHFTSITVDCPRVDRLYVQLVPRNEILQQPSKMAQVEAEDLWMERNSCYALLMRELFTNPPVENFKYLKIFESGDAADEEAWLLAVEFVKRNANGWAIASQGVFVKELKDKKSESAEGDVSALSVH